jgi:RHS repeat-associated protein
MKSAFRFPLSAFRFPLSAFRFPLSAFRFPLLVSCLICLCFAVSAQPLNKYINDIALAAPTAGGLGKYTDIPTAGFTGVQPIDIPLYTVKEGSLSLPISLSYHAGGIRVDELASWVGLGWSLNAGGVVTRTVLDRADDKESGYFSTGATLNPANWNANPFFDAEPDIFSFNFAGYSGKFIIDKDHNYRLIPQQDIVIEPVQTGVLSEFIFKTPNGNRYTFGNSAIELTTPDHYQTNSILKIEYATSWFLQKIESSDKLYSINFEYADEDFTYSNIASVSEFQWGSPCGGSSLTPVFQNNSENNKFVTRTRVKGKRLSKITTSMVTVDFVANTIREDLDGIISAGGGVPNSKRLENVNITSGAFCSKWALGYSYYKDPENSSRSEFKRLQLKELKEISCDNSILANPYKFTYEGTLNPDGTNFLKNRCSRAKDHWGYYNSQFQNDASLPFHPNIPAGTTISWPPEAMIGDQQTSGTSNRETDATAIKTGVLNKIEYPTGGAIFYNFECNTYAKYALPNAGPNLITDLKACYYSYAFSDCCSQFGPAQPVNTTITLTDDQIKNSTFRLKLKSSVSCQVGYPPYLSSAVSATIKASLGGTEIGSFSLNFSYPTTTEQEITEDLLRLGDLTAGTYVFTLSTSGGQATFNLLSTIPGGLLDPSVKVGGLRIKEIRVSPEGSAAITPKDIIRSFEYVIADNSAISSGVSFGVADYRYNANILGASPPVFTLQFTDYSTTPLYSFEGYNVAYKRVVENHNGNGRIIKTYICDPVPIPQLLGPIPIPNPVRSQNGVESKKVVSNQAGLALYNKSLSGTKAFNSGADIIVISGNAFKYRWLNFCNGAIGLGWGDTPTGFWAKPDISQYTLTTGNFKTGKIIETTDNVSKTTTYAYDNQNRFLSPISKQTTNSNGKVTLEEYKFVHDLSIVPLRTQLLARNMTAEPFQVTESVGGIQVSGTRKDYASFTASGSFESAFAVGTTSHVRPNKFYQYEMSWNNGTPTTGAWVLKGTTNSYNAFGLPTSFSFANWTDPETYVWNNNATLASKTYKSFITNYDYYPNTSLIRSITPVDGIKTCFTYDALRRLAKSTTYNASVNASGVVVDGLMKTEFFYHPKNIPASPADPYNWIKTKSTLVAVTGSNLTNTENIEYLDGLGRPQQTIKIGWSPNQKDVVSAVEYDNQGRANKQYTPFEAVAGTGAFNTTIPTAQTFTLNQFEASPLNRLIGVTPPSWYLTSTAFGTNVANEVGYFDGATSTSYFPAGSLSKQTLTTPQSLTKNTERITYTDKMGRLVLSRVREAGTTISADTYTLYDDKNRTVRVLPPGVTNSISEQNLRFDYAYDGADHLISSKVPDKGLVNIKYNLRDQAVLTQDANLLTGNKWLLTKYDDYGRVLQTGIHVAAAPDPNAVLAYTDVFTTGTYGTSTLEQDKLKTLQTFVPETAGVPTSITRTYGYDAVTGRKLTDFGNNHLTSYTGSDNYTYSYDYAGNPLSEVRVHKTSTAATALTLTNRNYYDFSGRKLNSTHQINSNTAVKLNQFAYDYRDRLIDKSLGAVSSGGINSYLQSIDYAYNDQNWLTSINGANSFSTALAGSAITLCTSTPIFSNPAAAPFAADPDGNDLFKMNLNYEATPYAFGTPTAQRNGNISQIVWQTRGRERQGYSYQYDFLDRLTTAYYADINNTGVVSTDNKFQENISYADLRGNISTLNRRGIYKDPVVTSCFTNGVIDNLQYTYSYGYNRLANIAESATGTIAKSQGFNPGTALNTATYGYDANGNMISDPYKAISSIGYNHLDLPTTFAFTGKGSIGILYDYVGKKLRKSVTPTTGTATKQDYVDGLEYKTTGAGALTLEAIYHGDGRITPAGAGWQYEYSIKDHLGNTRITFADLNANNVVDVPGDILQENHYYPFGMNMNYAWLNNAAQPDTKYQYNGKELNEDFGLNLYAYGFRYYDAAISRFISVDPLANKFPYLTTFQYASGNPVKNIDLDGLEGLFFGEMFFISESPVAPIEMIRPIAEVSKFGAEESAKPRFTAEQLENFARGRATENEQLTKNGYEKNNTPYTAELQNGEAVKTVPDAITEQKGTVEVKDVKYQSETKQLKAQRELSNQNGQRPELIVNEGAKLAKTLTNGNWKITTYEGVPTTPIAPQESTSTQAQQPNVPKVDYSKIPPKD